MRICFLGHGTINLHSFGRSFADDSMAQSSSSSKAAARSNSGRFVTWTSGKRNSARKRPTSTAIEFEKLLRIKSEIQLNLTKKVRSLLLTIHDTFWAEKLAKLLST